MTGSRIRSVLLASNSSRPAFLLIHGLSVSSLLRKSEASSSRSRISRRSFATSPCPDTTNAPRTSNPPYWLPRRHRWPSWRPWNARFCSSNVPAHFPPFSPHSCCQDKRTGPSTTPVPCSGQGQGLSALEMGALQNLTEQISFLRPTATFVKTFVS